MEDVWQMTRKTLGDETLSVILPVYNLASTIAANLAEVVAVLDEGGFSYEIIPVDDGSIDGSAKAICDFAASFATGHVNDSRRTCKPVLLDKNAGKGNALKEGFRASSGEFVLLLDGDRQGN